VDIPPPVDNIVFFGRVPTSSQHVTGGGGAFAGAYFRYLMNISTPSITTTPVYLLSGEEEDIRTPERGGTFLL
jgi:hypothetical protein